MTILMIMMATTGAMMTMSTNTMTIEDKSSPVPCVSISRAATRAAASDAAKNENYDEDVNEDEEIIIIIIRTWSQLGHNVLVNNHKHKILIQHICCMVQLTIKTIKETTASCVP